MFPSLWNSSAKQTDVIIVNSYDNPGPTIQTINSGSLYKAAQLSAPPSNGQAIGFDYTSGAVAGNLGAVASYNSTSDYIEFPGVFQPTVKVPRSELANISHGITKEQGGYFMLTNEQKLAIQNMIKNEGFVTSKNLEWGNKYPRERDIVLDVMSKLPRNAFNATHFFTCPNCRANEYPNYPKLWDAHF